MTEPPRPTPARPARPLPSDRDASGRDLGDAELAYLGEVVRSGHLHATGGTFVPRLERAFAARHGRRHAIACASGSAAVHAVLGALALESGDEVVTTPITDMGAILPIVYEGARPVFADVEPETGNVTPESVARCVGPRTRAVIVTHLFGQPCRTREIVDRVEPRGIVVIEDAAQAFLAEEDGRLAGTIGAAGCFSFQQGKHMTTGEGGIVVTDDDVLADGARRFVNKGWGYGDAQPDHDRPGLNFRLTELQAAVGLAQLEKLDGVVERRRASAERLRTELRGLPGLAVPEPRTGTRHAWWRFVLRIDPDVVPGGASAVAERLRAHGVASAPHYVRKPAFDCRVLAEPARFGATAALAALGPLGSPQTHPNAYRALERFLVLPWNEHFDANDVQFLADTIRLAHAECTAAR